MALTRSSITGTTVALSGVTLLARVRGAAGSLITQSSISTITYSVSNLTAGTTSGSTSLTVSAVVFNDLQQDDPRWTKDSASDPGIDGSYGYNFAATIPATAFAVSVLDSDASDPVPDQVRYQVDVVFTPTSGQPFRLVFKVNPVAVYA